MCPCLATQEEPTAIKRDTVYDRGLTTKLLAQDTRFLLVTPTDSTSSAGAPEAFVGKHQLGTTDGETSAVSGKLTFSRSISTAAICSAKATSSAWNAVQEEFVSAVLHSEAASQLVELSLRSILDETRYCLSRPSMEFCEFEEL